MFDPTHQTEYIKRNIDPRRILTGEVVTHKIVSTSNLETGSETASEGRVVEILGRISFR